MDREFQKKEEKKMVEGEEAKLKGPGADGKTEAVERTECAEEKEKKKDGVGPIDKAEAKLLMELPFYHGFLPRDDVNTVLRHDGDFILRLSEVDADGGLQLVLSVMVSQVPCEKEERVFVGAAREQLKLKHLIVSRQQGQYRLDDRIAFPTVKEMIAHFLQTPHLSKNGPVRLKKGIPLQKWEYAHSDVKMGDVLGAGAFGEVRQGLLLRKKGKKEVKVAVKLEKEGEEKKERDRVKEKIQEMMKEARIMKYMKHRNVVRLYGVMVLEQPIGIILELVDGGSVDKYLKKYKGLVEAKEKIQMCAGAAAGLAYIHSQRIIHRDIAARNCLYNSEKTIKISDFGLSRVTDKCETEYKIRKMVKLPIKWLAPETIKDLVFSTKTDVYSYGVLCFEIFTNGAEPFEEFGNTDTKQRVTSGQFLVLPEETPSKLKDFVQSRIFVLDREKRVSMGDVLRFMENAITESKMAEVQIEASVLVSTMKTQKTDTAPRSASRELVEELEKKNSNAKTMDAAAAAGQKNLTTEPLEKTKMASTPDKRSTIKPKLTSGLRKKKTHLKGNFGKKQ